MTEARSSSTDLSRDVADIGWVQGIGVVLITSRGAHFSTVEWVVEGVTYTDQIENDDIETWEEGAIEFDSYDD